MLFQAFRKVVDTYSGKIAVISSDGKVSTYLDLLRMIHCQVSELQVVGITPGDIVSTRLENSISYVSLLFSLAALGAIHCPISLLASKDRAAHRFSTVKPKLLISSDGSSSSDNSPLTLSLKQISRKTKNIDGCITSHPEIFRMQETSGSTGTSKLAVWRQDKMIYEIEHWIALAGISSSDIAFNVHTLDGGHAVDLHVLPILLSGGTLVLGNIESPEKALQAISDSRATVLSALPQQYKVLCNAAEATSINRLPHLRLPMCGGGYLSDTLIQESYEKLGIMIRRIYGSTEFGMILANLDPIIQTNCGMYPVGDVEVRLEPLGLEDMTIGEIVARSTHCGSGYFENYEKNDDKQDWYHTGDVAQQIDKKTFMPLGRLGDSLRTLQGIIFSPQLEEILASKLQLAQVVVLTNGKDIPGSHADIFVESIRQEDRKMIRIDIQNLMDIYGISSSLYLIDFIPLTPTGKPDKQALRSYAKGNVDKDKKLG